MLSLLNLIILRLSMGIPCLIIRILCLIGQFLQVFYEFLIILYVSLKSISRNLVQLPEKSTESNYQNELPIVEIVPTPDDDVF